MPVTAKLSREFHERLGDGVANGLVEWFNTVDADFRAQLRELNERNFARFDARLEQRIAGLRAEIRERFAAFEIRIEQRMASLEVKLEQRTASLEVKLDQRMASLEVKLEQRMRSLEVRTIRWMFTFWVGQTATLAGLMYVMLRQR